MKESKILVQEATGSVVSDNAINILQGEARNTAELSRKIGQLEGQINVLSDKNHSLERELQKSEKKVTVTIRSDKQNSGIMQYDPWSGLWREKPSKDETYIDRITSVNIDDISTLVNNAVKDEATKLIADADKELEKADKKVKAAEKELNDYKTLYNENTKNFNEKVKKAAEAAEKVNLDNINSLKISLNTKDKQLETYNREFKLFIQERDTLIEAMNIQIDLLEKQLELLRKSPRTLYNQLRDTFYRYKYSRRLRSSISN